MTAHRARKRFGQNFLHDRGIIQSIVRAVSPRADQRLLEIGPGQGAITAELLASGCRSSSAHMRRCAANTLCARLAHGAIVRLQEPAIDGHSYGYLSVGGGSLPCRPSAH